MACVWVLCVLACLATGAHSQHDDDTPVTRKEFLKQQTIMGALTRQIMMQQLTIEEYLRYSGDSGVQQCRFSNAGTRPWHARSHTGNAVNSIHDHSNNINTVGMGETSVMLNGVSFRTRHNDYKLQMPQTTSSAYSQVEDIPFPEVPPAVLAKETVEEQTAEMQQWFKAWATQRTSPRNYKDYFKPVLCYLEGSWTVSKDKIDEPFASDRHQIDATTWWDLTEKVRFTAYTGGKSNKENYSFLPMKIIDLMNNNTEPQFAQWNYRILCAPLKDDIPIHYLRPVDDLSSRMVHGRTLEEHSKTRAARFFIDNFTPKTVKKERMCAFCYLDQLMEQIPGKDNYVGDLRDDAFGLLATHYQTNEPLNTAFYHRRYKVAEAGAMGTKTRKRAYSDQNVFMAQTSQPQVPGLKVTDCIRANGKQTCTDYYQRWSYAIPLEIVYLTPLSKWNPYDLEFKGYNTKENKPNWNSVLIGGRNGGLTPEKAYDGTRNNLYYRTPAGFFGGGGTERDPADTDKGTVGVLDREGNVRRVVASGSRIFLPNIPGVGSLRIRYPISAIHEDGNVAYKEQQALQDIVMRMDTYGKMLREKPSLHPGTGGSDNEVLEFILPLTAKNPPGLHSHFVSLTSDELASLYTGGKVRVETTEEISHSHDLLVSYEPNATNGPWIVEECDNRSTCWDQHPMHLRLSE